MDGVAVRSAVDRQGDRLAHSYVSQRRIELATAVGDEDVGEEVRYGHEFGAGVESGVDLGIRAIVVDTSTSPVTSALRRALLSGKLVIEMRSTPWSAGFQ